MKGLFPIRQLGSTVNIKSLKNLNTNYITSKKYSIKFEYFTFKNRAEKNLLNIFGPGISNYSRAFKSPSYFI